MKEKLIKNVVIKKICIFVAILVVICNIDSISFMRTVLGIILLFGSVNLFAWDITAKSSECLPAIVYKQQVTYLSPSFTDVGIWNFSDTLQSKNKKEYCCWYASINSDTTSYCCYEYNTRYYYKYLNDSLLLQGFENATTKLRYSKPDLVLRYPLSIHDTISGHYMGKGEYCKRIPLNTTGESQTHVYATGKLLLPDIMIDTAICLHSIKNDYLINSDTIHTTTHTYRWFSDSHCFPLLESIQTLSKDSVLWQTSFYVPQDMIQTALVNDSILQVFREYVSVDEVFTEATFLPNPVQHDLHINYKLKRSARVWFTLHDNSGILLRRIESQLQEEGYHTITISMGGLPTKIYTLYIHVDDMILVENIIKL